MNEISNDYPDSIHIEWVLSNICNYKCSYCVPDLNNGSSGKPNIHDAIKFFNYVHKEVNSNAKMLTISGGEPTLWPDLIKFLNLLDESYYTALVTNASRSIRWWNDFILNCKKIHRITISVHLEYADINHIIDVCKILENKVRVTVLLMFDTQYKNTFFNFLNKIKDSNLGISLSIKPLSIRTKNNITREYSEEEKNLIKTFKYGKIKLPALPIANHLVIDGQLKNIFYAHDLMAENKHTFKGWFCEIGKKRLVIWHDGNIFPAQCNTAKKIPLGNIKDNTFKKIEGAFCENDFCDCIPDIRIPKKKFNNFN